MLSLRTGLAVAIGAMIGAALRYLADELIPFGGGWPWPTFVVNVVGCAAIAVAAVRLDPTSTAWAFVAPGALGGLTTMSTFLVEARALWLAEDRLLATAYVVVTLVVTLGAVDLVRTRSS